MPKTIEAVQAALALKVAQEWQQVIAALAADTVEALETVKEVELKEGRQGHPFYWGKMSILRTLRELADSDVKRFQAGEDILAELAELRRRCAELTQAHCTCAACRESREATQP